MATQTVTGDSGSTFSALKSLWPYMWPPDRRDLKLRLVWATVLLVLAAPEPLWCSPVSAT